MNVNHSDDDQESQWITKDQYTEDGAEIGLPTTDGDTTTNDRITYLFVTSDSSESSLSQDVGHIFGRLGQGDLTKPH